MNIWRKIDDRIYPNETRVYIKEGIYDSPFRGCYARVIASYNFEITYYRLDIDGGADWWPSSLLELAGEHKPDDIREVWQLNEREIE